jgi:electron transfer flavoprotein beta subunit
MKVLVAVKEVVEVAEDFEIEGTAIASRYREYDLNEWDDYAVEAAVQLQEADLAEEVVSVTIGPERAEETIRMALAKGIDRAVRIWDDALADQELLDVASKARLLEAVIAEEEPDLVLTGVQAGDDAWGATGVSLAHAVGYGWAAVVTGLEIEGDTAHVRRELEGGVEELVDVQLPAVLTIQTGLNEPRYASLRGIRQAQSKEITPRSLADLGLDPNDVRSAIDLTEMFVPEAEGDTEYLEGDTGDQAAGLAEVLREKGVGAE